MRSRAIFAAMMAVFLLNGCAAAMIPVAAQLAPAALPALGLKSDAQRGLERVEQMNKDQAKLLADSIKQQRELLEQDRADLEDAVRDGRITRQSDFYNQADMVLKHRENQLEQMEKQYGQPAETK